MVIISENIMGRVIPPTNIAIKYPNPRYIGLGKRYSFTNTMMAIMNTYRKKIFNVGLANSCLMSIPPFLNINSIQFLQILPNRFDRW